MATDRIEELLKQRDSSHGDYDNTARIAQILKETMHVEEGWNKLNYKQAEALDMIATKIGRILGGDPNFPDHYADIIGYVTLVMGRK